jgi:hypothetical protein
LETEIAADDIADATIVRARHADNVSQNDFRQETTQQAQCKDAQQMNIGLPLPHFESEGLENGNRQHHEGTTDKADADSFFVIFVHTAGKSNTISSNHQTIHHFSTILSHFHYRLSQTYAEYPRNLALFATIHNFASSNNKIQ